MIETFVLDSFAVLALLGREPGSQEVADLLRKARGDETRVLMTWVNAGEVAYIVERRWGAERLYAALALMAAHIKAKHAIAYANAFAAALAEHGAAKLVTGDPEFKLLEGILDIHWLPQRES